MYVYNSNRFRPFNIYNFLPIIYFDRNSIKIIYIGNMLMYNIVLNI